MLDRAADSLQLLTADLPFLIIIIEDGVNVKLQTMVQGGPVIIQF